MVNNTAQDSTSGIGLSTYNQALNATELCIFKNIVNIQIHSNHCIEVWLSSEGSFTNSNVEAPCS